MGYQNHYGGVIFTNHALERLGQRGLTQEMALKAYKSPDRSMPAKQGGTEFQKQFGKSTVTIIAKQNERNEWLIISCWIDPPLPGTEDFKKQTHYRRYQQASFWGKIFLSIKQQLGFS